MMVRVRKWFQCSSSLHSASYAARDAIRDSQGASWEGGWALALGWVSQGGPRWRHSGGRAGMRLETGKCEVCHFPKGQHNHYH